MKEQRVTLGKYSIGTGDRFGMSTQAQLEAIAKAAAAGVNLGIVWNKSHREHKTLHSHPRALGAAAGEAVKNLGWKGNYHLDADHINMDSVDTYMDSCDYFTIDVADFIGKPAEQEAVQGFVQAAETHQGAANSLVAGDKADRDHTNIEKIAQNYLAPVQEAGRIYRRIRDRKGEGNFITEVSIDETSRPQSPPELFFILFAIAREGIPLQTIAPRFSGRFNKGVDYIGNLETFDREFAADIQVLDMAVRKFGLPENLRQLMHVGYKIAAEMGERFIRERKRCSGIVNRNVTENIFERHIRLLFLEKQGEE